MPDTRPPIISLTDLRVLLADPALRIWLIHATDTRPFAAGHIAGSLAGPDLPALRRLARDVPIVVYAEDEHAVAAPRIAADLQGRGVEVRWFAGGIRAWVHAGLPLEGSG